jgi:hypothetical protein
MTSTTMMIRLQEFSQRDDDEGEVFATEECERGIVEGEYLDDLDLEEFDSKDVKKVFA